MRCAVVGLGIGMAHVAGYLQHPEAELAAVADRLPERRARVGGTFAAGSMQVLKPLFEPPEVEGSANTILGKRWEEIGVTVHDDITGIERDGSLELVSVCTPDDTHEEYTHRLLDAGKRVLLEKPVALTMEGADRLARRVASMATQPWEPVGLGYEFRLNPAVARLRRLAHDGTLGTPRAFALYHLRTPFRRDKYERWIQDKSRSGGLLVEETCHWFDLARWVMGDEVRSVSCVGIDDIHPDFNFEDLAFVQGRYRSGGVFQISHSLTASDFCLILQVHGTKGSAWCGLKEDVYTSLDAGCSEYLGVLSHAPHNAAPRDAVVTTFGWEATEPRNIRACTAAAVDAVQSGGPWPASVFDGVESLRIALAARQSMEEGREITLWSTTAT